MVQKLNICLAQSAARCGDLAHNAALVRRIALENSAADLVVFPELHLCGYPPEDLVRKPAFIEACHAALLQLASDLEGLPTVLVGTPWQHEGKLYNAMAFLSGGKIEALRFKNALPNYGVFDEKRVFDAGPLPRPIELKGIKIGVPICEDIWEDGDVVAHLVANGAELLIVPNGSPFEADKLQLRQAVAKARVQESGLPLLYLNRVGGQDELVFDGASFALCGDGGEVCQLAAFEEDTASLEWKQTEFGWRCDNGTYAALPDDTARLYSACCLGLRDYVAANGFKNVLLGLSGGIDSALVAALCVDALGSSHVSCIMLPSEFTSQASLEDAEACAAALHVSYEIMPLTPLFDAAEKAVQPSLAGKARGLTLENLQSRLRGTLLMALSNQSDAMLVTTGNKSEMAVGYATLYGDMNGGFNPIKDLYKTIVYKLAEWRNAHVPKIGLGPSGIVIPLRILRKAPSAELRAGQTDQDSLPPYDILDAILCRLIEQEKPAKRIADEGFDPVIVAHVEKLLLVSEFKRRQAPPGVKLTSRSFGRDRRYPISNGFIEEDTGKSR